MEIRNIFMKQAMIAPDQPVVLQKGETYEAVVKEKKGDEAVVHLKGTDVRVRTEGEWPQEGRVTIKIVGEQEGVPVARIVPRPPQEANEQAVRFSASEPLPTELRQVDAWLQKQGQPLTKETVSTLRTFFTEAPGTVEQKLETVRAVINKKLELTSTHLAAVHEALHGKPLGEQFTEIVNSLDPTFTLAKREEQSAMKEAPQNLTVAADRFDRQAGRTGKTGELSSAPPSLAADQSAKAGSTEGTKSSEISGRKALGHRPLVPTWDHLERTVQMETASTTETSTRLQQVREQVAREPNLPKAVEYVRQQVVDAPNVDRDVAEQVDRALREVVQLQRQGREGEARVRLNEVSTRLEQTVQTEKMPSIETSTRLQQVREQVAREPSLSKAVEYVRQQVVHMPNVERNVAEQVDRALREVAQLQRQGRESEARARLSEALVKAEQAARALEATVSFRNNVFRSSQDLRDQIQEIRTQVAKAPDLSKALEQVQKQLVENIDVPAEVREKAAVAVKEAQWLKMNGQEVLARRTLVQALEDMERVVQPKTAPATETSTRLQQVREQITREPNLSKAVEYVRQQVVDAPNVDRDVVEQVDRALREVAQLQQQGREGEARVRLNEVLTRLEQAVQPEKTSSTETSTRLQQVREQITREPNLSKAVEYVRQQVVDAPNVDRDVVEQVDRALREVVQLQRQGREGEARARLSEALVKAEQVARVSEVGRQLRDTHLQASRDLRDQIQEVRTQVAKAPDLSKALEQVQKRLVENIDVPAEVREKAAVAVKEAQWLKANGQEVLARRNLVQALEDVERAVQPEAAPATETSTRLQQVREQVAREPNLSKAVEYVRQQVVHMPNVERNVAEQVDRALREVVQLQRQGREGEARARLSEALVKAEQAARALEATVQSVSDASQPSPELPKQIRAIRTEAVRALNLSNTLSQVQKLLAKHSELPGDVRQKIEAVLKETMWLQQAGQHAAARTHLVRQLDQIESIAANTRSSVVQPPSPVNETTAPFKMPAVDHISVSSEMAEGAGQEGISQRSTAPVVEQSGDDGIGNGARQAISSAGSQNEVTADVANDNQPTEQLREAIRRAIKSLQQEPHLEKALDAVGADIAEALRARTHWEQAWADSSASARTLMEKGRELAARQTVLKTLNEIEASLPSAPTDRSLDVDSLFDGAWQAALSLESKQFLVQTVTKKMAQAALDFKTVKRDVMRQLEAVAQVAENKSPAARLQATSMLEMAIKQLDNAILKSDIMLFTDMVTEKQLMKASSALAEAKKRLRQGDAAGARNIVNEVKNMLANIVFKPSEAKVKHFVRMHGETTADSSKAFLEQVNQVMQPPVDGPSARHVFDTIRRLGLTHEHEAAEWLVFKGNQEESASQNMKEVLLRLAQSGNESVARQAEQALTNLTGQQLLNKWDGTAGWQSVFFTLPLLWQNEVQNVNVYVNARQHGERIDWENCQLYFLLETRKLGDLGILLHANERNLSITLRNDRDDFAEKVKPFIDIAKEKLEEIGYRVTAVNVAKLTNDAHQKDEPPSPAPSARPYRRFAERGYDWTI
ncbi:hypothetical protein UM396_16315 [Geobacillus subterraneus]|uniref:hypothetical protein n=1 Tax=Geobacillus subterraneus TaxID=129338 RepID=UPI002AC9B289|nr:hypothetical protein [Geobacillus subterraneus]WPZ18104.1 hypothetical protein UM396_16315 [Geobacillus subterraneus]